MKETPAPSPSPQAPKASFASRLFGYDVFVSFALGGPPRGSQSYASDLARRLRERDLSVFFSEDEAPPGAPLSDTLRRALLRSKLLVVVVNRGTLALPNWVRTEVETFRAERPGRPVIPVCLDGSFRDPVLSEAAQPWLQHGGSIWLDEQPDSAARGLATDPLVARLLTAPRRLTANRLWRAFVGAVGLGLAVLAALAVWQALVALRERDRANALRDQALSRQLAAQSTASLVRDPVRALLLAVQSQAIVRTPASDGALLGVMSSLPVARLQQHPAAFAALAVSPQGDALVLADAHGAVLRGALDRPAVETVVPPTTGINLYGAVTAIAFAPDGRTWAHAGSSREITVHQATGSSTLPDGDKIGESTPSFVFGLAFSPDGATLAAVSSGRSLRLHELASRSARLLLNAAVDLTAVAFSPDGRWVVAGGDQGFMQAVAVAPGAAVPRLATSAIGAVAGLAFDASGRWVFAASRGGRIEVFDALSGERIAKQDVPGQGALERMAVSPDGRFVVTGHGNGAVMRWSWTQDAQPWPGQALLRHAGAVRGLAFAADGRTLVSAGQDGRLFVTLPVDLGRWQRWAGPAPAPQQSEARGVRSPDGRWIAWPGTTAPPPAPFSVDTSGLSSVEVPRLTVIRASDRQPVVDGAELPGEMGESIAGNPVFAADSARVAVQVGGRLLFWDLPAAAPLDAALALPPGARLLGAAPDGAGWIAGADPQAQERFFFEAGLGHWAQVSCRLAGRRLTLEEWRRYVGAERPYAPACT
ncbi:TIR domain-containing protein [Variovorax sp. J22P271]|uniref:toll/interleukin-1 receptor domain-containing protein n=1 Tax=Variovorax davisae TaxID=3053515 RepID=UPI002575FC92|nr:TIR domain-containing protein [Variovorax sp. J22P271]MDM0035052.1 TIR domain-containing protein [Variovorax sp. J22P271]